MTPILILLAILLVSAWILSSLAVSFAMWKSAGRIDRAMKFHDHKADL